METVVKEFDHKGYTVEIGYDEDTEPPRSWDNVGSLFIKSRRGCEVDELTDSKHFCRYLMHKDNTFVRGIDWDDYERNNPEANATEWEELDLLNPGEFANWDVHQEAIEFANLSCLVLPVYKYEHSQVAYSVHPFSCRWDSGQVGFIWCSKEQIDHEWQGDRSKAEGYLGCEVSTYGQWANGEVYRYAVKLDGIYIDGCGGYYDDSTKLDYVTSEAIEFIEHDIKNNRG